MKQRRGSYRIAYPIETRYALAPTGVTLSALNPQLEQVLTWNGGMLSDISTGGARVHGKIQIATAVDMILGIQFPSDFLEEMATKRDHMEMGAFGPRVRMVEVKPNEFPRLLLLGTVVNVALNTATRTFVHNIQFNQIRVGDQDQIERFINLRQRYELKFRRR